MKRICINILLVFLIVGISWPVYAQTVQTPFGKNRVQYHDDFDSWWMYETENFVIFWYGKGRNIAKSVIQLAELDHDEIEKILAHSMNDKIRIIIYLDHSDYTQTNISYFDTREAGGAGKARFYDNKAIVYFDGNHQDLRKQIRAGIVQAYLKSMFNGISMQEIYQNLVSSELPNWFVAGLVDYLTEKWPANLQQELDGMFRERSRKVKKFESFARDYPVLAGHSMWHFLSLKYGDQSISDFLYLVRIHNDIDKAFNYVFNRDEDVMYDDWYAYYKRFFNIEISEDLPLEQEERIIKHLDHPVTRVMFDPSGDQLYFVENNFGRVELFERNLSSSKEHRLMKYGYKNKHQITDMHYPLIKYNRSNDHLGVIYEHKDQLYFRDIDPTNDQFTEVLFPQQVQRIYDFDFEAPGHLIFTGSLDGFTDVFLFNIEKRQTELLTESHFDESQIQSFPEIKGDYLAVSNHPGNYLQPAEYDSFPPIKNFDVFEVDRSFKQANNLSQTENSNEKYPILMGTDQMLVLTDATGLERPQIWSKTGKQAAVEGLVETSVGIETHDYSNGKYVYVYRESPDEWCIGLEHDLSNDIKQMDAINPDLIGLREMPEQIENSEQNAAGYQKDLVIEIDESLKFQTEFNDPEVSPEDWIGENPGESGRREMVSPGDEMGLPIFKRSNAVASRLRFSFTELTTRVDNQALFEGLETFDQYSTSYQGQPTGFLIKSSVRDLFEDHVLEGGFRLSSDFRGMEYFITYDDLKRKWDWKYALYRKTDFRFENIIESTPEADKIKKRVHLGMVKAKYPFDVYRSLHLSGMLRFDNTIVAASESESFVSPNIGFQRFILGAEYIFDNTSEKAPNLLSGTRYKFFTRFSNRFNINLSDPFIFDLSEGIMGVVGFDARHYVDLLKHSVLAFRIAGQTSFGSEQNIYFLGGIDNWLFSRTDDSYPIPQDQEFAFKVQAGNVRGFPYNIRNGSTFTLANAEIRIPVFTYLIRGHIKSAFIRDFQITGFLDAGMAWYGLSPFSEKNSANVYYLEAPPAVILRVKQIQDPLVGGMGVGLRTSVFGYFLKLDYAWGIQSRKIQEPILYLSLGYDF